MQMIPRNVPYGSDCWITETGFLVGLAYQREERPDNQDHMPAEGLSPQPSHIGYMCPVTRRRDVCLRTNTAHTRRAHITSISTSKWNTGPQKEKFKTSDKIFDIQDPLWSFHYVFSSEHRKVTACFGWETLWDLGRLFRGLGFFFVFFNFLSRYLDTSLEAWLDAVYHNRPDMAIACLPLINGAREERHIFGMLHLYRYLTDSSVVNPLTILDLFGSLFLPIASLWASWHRTP